MKGKSTRETITNFRAWLVNQGAEVLAPTNEYELIRFRCATGVGVVYQNKHGVVSSFSGPEAQEAFDCYKNSKSWKSRPTPTSRACRSKSGANRLRKQIVDRDGPDCFYCKEPLGEDMSIEHVLELKFGGSDRVENMVLAHFACNQAVDGLSISKKLRYRETNCKKEGKKYADM